MSGGPTDGADYPSHPNDGKIQCAVCETWYEPSKKKCPRCFRTDESFDELLQELDDRVSKGLISPQAAVSKLMQALAKFRDLTADRLRTLGRDEDYNEIEEIVRKELL